jgi:hypothetical protein
LDSLPQTKNKKMASAATADEFSLSLTKINTHHQTAREVSFSLFHGKHPFYLFIYLFIYLRLRSGALSNTSAKNFAHHSPK